MRPVPVFPDYLVKVVIPVSRAILKPDVIWRCVSLVLLPACVFLCFIKPILGNRYGPGVNP